MFTKKQFQMLSARATFGRPLKETNACLGKCRETFRRLLINALIGLLAELPSGMRCSAS